MAILNPLEFLIKSTNNVAVLLNWTRYLPVRLLVTILGTLLGLWFGSDEKRYWKSCNRLKYRHIDFPATNLSVCGCGGGWGGMGV